MNLRFQKKMQQLENPQSIRWIKREIANQVDLDQGFTDGP